MSGNRQQANTLEIKERYNNKVTLTVLLENDDETVKITTRKM